MSISIYRLALLKGFLRRASRVGECTICYDTSRLYALHGKEYRHGLCKECKTSYTKNQCHICRVRLNKSSSLRIDTSPEDPEALLDAIFDISNESTQQEITRHVTLISADLYNIAQFNFVTYNQYFQVLRRILRSCDTIMDTPNGNLVLVRPNLGVRTLDYIIRDTLCYHISPLFFLEAINRPRGFDITDGIVELVLQITSNLDYLLDTSRRIPDDVFRFRLGKLKSLVFQVDNNIQDTYVIEAHNIEFATLLNFFIDHEVECPGIVDQFLACIRENRRA
jgi:hypothetical protein